MTFAFNSTVGSSSANSYISVSEAGDYFDGRVDGAKWDEFDTDVQQKALVTATRQIDQYSFAGTKASSTQALKWPRANVYDEEGVIYSSTSLPKNLKYATCELAFYYVTADDRDFNEWQVDTYDSFSAGPLNVKFRASSNDLPDTVVKELKNIGPGAWTSGSEFGTMRW